MALVIGKMRENKFCSSQEIWSKILYEWHKSMTSYIIILLSLLILLLLLSSFSPFRRASACFSRQFFFFIFAMSNIVCHISSHVHLKLKFLSLLNEIRLVFVQHQLVQVIVDCGGEKNISKMTFLKNQKSFRRMQKESYVTQMFIVFHTTLFFTIKKLTYFTSV